MFSVVSRGGSGFSPVFLISLVMALCSFADVSIRAQEEFTEAEQLSPKIVFSKEDFTRPVEINLITPQSELIQNPIIKIRTLIALSKAVPGLFQDAYHFEIDLMGTLGGYQGLVDSLKDDQQYKDLWARRGPLLHFHLIPGESAHAIKSYRINQEGITQWQSEMAAAVQKYISPEKGEDYSRVDIEKTLIEAFIASQDLNAYMNGLCSTIEEFSQKKLDRAAVFGLEPSELLKYMRETLPRDPVEFGFRAKNFEIEDENFDSEKAVLRLKAMIEAEEAVKELVAPYLFASRWQRWTPGPRLDEGMLDQIRDSELLRKNLEALVKVSKRPIEKTVAWKTLRRKLRAVETNLVQRGSVELGELYVEEVPPMIGIYRGCAGNDCATSNSWPYPASPAERVFFVRDSQKRLRGYFQFTHTMGSKAPKIYFHTVNGSRLNAAHVYQIFDLLIKKIADFSLKADGKAEKPSIQVPGNHTAFYAMVNRVEIRDPFKRVTAGVEQSTQEYIDLDIRAKCDAKVLSQYDRAASNLNVLPIDLSRMPKIDQDIRSLPSTPLEISLPELTDLELLKFLIGMHISGHEGPAKKIMDQMKLPYSAENLAALFDLFSAQVRGTIPTSITIAESLQKIGSILDAEKLGTLTEWMKENPHYFYGVFLKSLEAKTNRGFESLAPDSKAIATDALVRSIDDGKRQDIYKYHKRVLLRSSKFLKARRQLLDNLDEDGVFLELKNLLEQVPADKTFCDQIDKTIQENPNREGLTTNFWTMSLFCGPRFKSYPEFRKAGLSYALSSNQILNCPGLQHLSIGESDVEEAVRSLKSSWNETLSSRMQVVSRACENDSVRAKFVEGVFNLVDAYPYPQAKLWYEAVERLQLQSYLSEEAKKKIGKDIKEGRASIAQSEALFTFVKPAAWSKEEALDLTSRFDSAKMAYYSWLRDPTQKTVGASIKFKIARALEGVASKDAAVQSVALKALNNLVNDHPYRFTMKELNGILFFTHSGENREAASELLFKLWPRLSAGFRSNLWTGLLKPQKTQSVEESIGIFGRSPGSSKSLFRLLAEREDVPTQPADLYIMRFYIDRTPSPDFLAVARWLQRYANANQTRDWRSDETREFLLIYLKLQQVPSSLIPDSELMRATQYLGSWILSRKSTPEIQNFIHFYIQLFTLSDSDEHDSDFVRNQDLPKSPARRLYDAMCRNNIGLSSYFHSSGLHFILSAQSLDRYTEGMVLNLLRVNWLLDLEKGDANESVKLLLMKNMETLVKRFPQARSELGLYLVQGYHLDSVDIEKLIQLFRKNLPTDSNTRSAIKLVNQYGSSGRDHRFTEVVWAQLTPEEQSKLEISEIDPEAMKDFAAGRAVEYEAFFNMGVSPDVLLRDERTNIDLLRIHFGPQFSLESETARYNKLRDERSLRIKKLFGGPSALAGSIFDENSSSDSDCDEALATVKKAFQSGEE